MHLLHCHSASAFYGDKLILLVKQVKITVMPRFLFPDKIIPLQITVVIKYFGQINIPVRKNIPVALRKHIKVLVHLTV